MPTTAVLLGTHTFERVPVKTTKRGAAIPRPAVLRTSPITGKENSHDKEWDGRSAPFTWQPAQFALAHITYTPVGKAGFEKTINSMVEVDRQTWNQAMTEWRQYLVDHAEDFTSTHATVTSGISLVRNPISRSTASVPNTPPVPSIPTPVPASLVTQVTSANGLPDKTWDPDDVDIADDLYEIPNDNPAFLPDQETFKIMDITWAEAMRSDEPKQVLIYGDTSTGKTEHPIIWCARNGVLHVRIDCGAFGEIYDVTGPIKAVAGPNGSYTEWVKGKLIRAMADPRPAVIQLDEVNRISDVKAMNILFPFFDSARQSYFDDNQTWMKLNGVKLIVATMNGDTRGDDIGEYVGTQPLDQAFVSRFPIRRQLRYPDADKLTRILTARAAGRVTDTDIASVAQIAQDLVALNKFVPNLRELFSALDFLADDVDMYHALKWTVGGIYKDDGSAACDFTSFKAVLIGKNINVDES